MDQSLESQFQLENVDSEKLDTWTLSEQQSARLLKAYESHIVPTEKPFSSTKVELERQILLLHDELSTAREPDRLAERYSYWGPRNAYNQHLHKSLLANSISLHRNQRNDQVNIRSPRLQNAIPIHRKPANSTVVGVRGTLSMAYRHQAPVSVSKIHVWRYQALGKYL